MSYSFGRLKLRYHSAGREKGQNLASRKIHFTVGRRVRPVRIGIAHETDAASPPRCQQLIAVVPAVAAVVVAIAVAVVPATAV